MNCVVDIWESKPEEAGIAFVIPDGCRDVIIKQSNCTKRVSISPLYTSCMKVEMLPDEKIIGYRLAPDCNINETALIHAIAQGENDIEDKIGTFAKRNSSVEEVLSCIRESRGTVTEVSRSLGVTDRTLQRFLVKNTSKPPVFWLQLERIRHSAIAYLEGMPLIEVSYEYGFADQPHFCRQFKRWLGVSPREFTNRDDLISQLYSPVY